MNNSDNESENLEFQNPGKIEISENLEVQNSEFSDEYTSPDMIKLFDPENAICFRTRSRQPEGRFILDQNSINDYEESENSENDELGDVPEINNAELEDNISVHSETFSYSTSTPSTEAIRNESIKIKLKDLTIPQLRDAAADFGFLLKEAKKQSMIKQLKAWMDSNVPDHEKIGKDYVFEIGLQFSQTRILTELTKIELELLIKNYRLPPAAKFSLKPAILAHVIHFMNIKYPNHKKDQNGILVFGPIRQ